MQGCLADPPDYIDHSFQVNNAFMFAWFEITLALDVKHVSV